MIGMAWWNAVVVNTLCPINVVVPRRARLVPGRFWTGGQVNYLVGLYDQPPRST